MDHLAHHHALTKLPNRLLLDERLKRAFRHGEWQDSQLELLFLDLDNSKHIDESPGHPTGDRLLQAVGAKLAHTARRDDTVSRIGGDEFVVRLEDIDKPENLGVAAKRLLSAFSGTLALDDREAGQGICLFPRYARTQQNRRAMPTPPFTTPRRTDAAPTISIPRISPERHWSGSCWRTTCASRSRKSICSCFFQPQVDLRTWRIILSTSVDPSTTPRPTSC